MGRFIQNGTGVVVSVADEKDHRFTNGWKPYSKVSLVAQVDGYIQGMEKAKPKSETPDKSWKVDELKAHAAERSIDLGDATKKDDILAAITGHTVSDNSEDESGSGDSSETE